MKQHMPSDTIWVADALPHQAPEIKRVNKQEFAQKQGFTWTEQFVLDSHISQEEQTAMARELDAQLLRICPQHWSEIEDSLMLCPMGEAGYGVFARKRIRGGFVIPYFGHLFKGNKVVRIEKGCHNYVISTPEHDTSIDAFKFAGMARYFQHLFTAESPEVIFNIEPADNFAVANLGISFAYVKGQPFLLLVCQNIDVAQGTLLGYDYGLDYFKADAIKPIIFSLNGEPHTVKALYEECTGDLLELRKSGLQLYQYLEGLKLKVPTNFNVNINNDTEFSEYLCQLDFDVLRSVAAGTMIINQTDMLRSDWSAIWKDQQTFAKYLIPKLNNRNEFTTYVLVFTHHYRMCEILSSCDSEMLTKLNSKYPKKFNYFELFSQGFANSHIHLQIIILKNTGANKIAKPTLRRFIDENKAFFHHVKKCVPALHSSLLKETAKYKMPAEGPVIPPHLQVLHQKPMTQEDFRAICEHLNKISDAEWKHSFDQKRIYVQGDKGRLQEIHDYLVGSNIVCTKISPMPKKDNVHYFDIREFTPQKINTLQNLPKVGPK